MGGTGRPVCPGNAMRGVDEGVGIGTPRCAEICYMRAWYTSVLNMIAEA
jgi:hypothetical protein